jgi:intracellular septation protein
VAESPSPLKLVLDFLPAVAIFATYALTRNIYAATIAIMIALTVVAVYYRVRTHKWHAAHTSGAILVVAFGALTLYLQNDAFIKAKPTAYFAILALALLGSHVIGKQVLMRRFMSEAMELPDPVWKRLNVAWAGFFAFCAALNWYVAHSMPEIWWVYLKAWGFLVLTLAFGVLQYPFLARYIRTEEAPAA